MAIYDRLTSTALKLLTKYGISVTLTRRSLGSGGEYNPDTGSANESESNLTETRKIIVTDNAGTRIGIQYGRVLQNGTLVQTTDKWMYMDASGSEPQLQDLVLFNGYSYSVLDVQIIGPGGQAVLYLIVVRK